VSTRKDPNITKSDIENFYLAFPKELNEQNSIAKVITETKHIISKSKEQLSKLESVKTGLLQDLLGGRVRV
jgi:type I restriction enzyme S subunit